MGKITRFVAVIFLCILSVITLKSQAEEQASSLNLKNKNIMVEINYGNVRPSRTVEVPQAEGRTALELLQTVATVETHPVNQYVFVTAIDGVKGKRGDMAWYYTVDGKSAEKIAYSNVLENNVDQISWLYKKDVCSKKVDEGI